MAGPLRILVVDDDEDNANSLGELFELEGHQVMVGGVFQEEHLLPKLRAEPAHEQVDSDPEALHERQFPVQRFRNQAADIFTREHGQSALVSNQLISRQRRRPILAR